MAKCTLAIEHKKFFQINGFISFKELITPDEICTVCKTIEKRQAELPGIFQENLFKSLPSVLRLAEKMGKIAAGLLDRKPVRIAYDCFAKKNADIPEIEEREIGLLLSLEGEGFFFIDSSSLYNLKEPCYLLFVFTANFTNNPIVST